MPRPAQAERETLLTETRQRLFEAAVAEFARHGFEGANVNTISMSAGFSKATIYNYFPSKRSLMDALIDTLALSQTTRIRAEVSEVAAPRDRLQRFLEAGFRFVEENPQEARVIIAVAYGPDEGFRDRLYQAYDGLFHLIIEEILGVGLETGDFRPEDPYTVAAMIMAVYLGASSQMDAEGRIWLDPKLVSQFVLEGIGR
jgi:AcrR family transcriptional regulator